MFPREMPKNNPVFHPRIVLEDDAIRKAITGDRWNAAAESQVYAIKYGMIRTLMVQGYDVLVDDTHTTKPSIQRLLEIDLKADFVYIDTPMQECMKRAIETDQSDLIEVIRRQYFNICSLTSNGFLLPDDRQETIVGIARAISNVSNEVVSRMEHSKRV